MRFSADSNDELVDYLVEQGYIETERVERAFRNVDRARFIPEGKEDVAYVDNPVTIAENATVSAPHMVAVNTELLEVEEDSRVAEVGSGSGYQLAILSELADKAVGVEIIPELVRKSRERLENRENVELIQGDGLEPTSGGFDRILYFCAIDSFDEARENLRENGVAVAPIYSDGVQILKQLKDSEVIQHGRVSFVPRTEMEREFRED